MRLQCSGWWEQQGYGRQPMRDLRLTFSNGNLSASGSDIVGQFEFSGSLFEGEIYLLKQYLGKHRIEYHGVSLGEGLYAGDWSSFGYPGGRWLIRIERTIEDTLDSTTDVHDWKRQP